MVNPKYLDSIQKKLDDCLCFDIEKFYTTEYNGFRVIPPGWRQLAPDEFVENKDIIWASYCSNVGVIGNGFFDVITGSRPSCRINPATFWEIDWPQITAKETIPALIVRRLDIIHHYWNVSGNKMEISCGVWRFKTTIKRHPWQDEPLPLP